MPVDFAPRHRFTVDDFHRMGEVGILTDTDRVELINGEIVQMTPIGSRHAACVRELDRWLQRLLGNEALVSAQQPLVINRDGEPIPDIAVLRPRHDGYRASHPTAADALLVIEVADSSAIFDRNVKSRVYGEAGIPEYWVVDLQSDTVIVFDAPEQGKYMHEREYIRGERWRSEGLGGREVSTDIILDGPDGL